MGPLSDRGSAPTSSESPTDSRAQRGRERRGGRRWPGRRDGWPVPRTCRSGWCSGCSSAPWPARAPSSSTKPCLVLPICSSESWPATTCRRPIGEGGHAASASFSRPWALPLVVGLGALLGALLVFRFAPDAEGHGTDAAISAVHHNPRGIRFRTVIVKIVASALTIGSGGSGGREGPTGQISAGFASLLARELDLSPADARTAVATGIGSGIGAIFGAPLGGAVLATEILYRDDFDVEALLPCFIASIVGYVIFGAAIGFTPLFGFNDSYHFSDPSQLLWFALIGVLGGIIGLLYAKGFYGIAALFTRITATSLGEASHRRCARGLHRVGHPRGARHRIRLDPTKPRSPAPLAPPLDRPHLALRPHRGHRAVDRIGRLRWNLRTGNGHRGLHRGVGLATVRPDRSLHGTQPDALRHRGHDVLLREHLPSAVGGDVDGGRDDREPVDPGPSHGRRRTGLVHRPARRRHHLPQPAEESSRRPRPTAPRRDAPPGQRACQPGHGPASPCTQGQHPSSSLLDVRSNRSAFPVCQWSTTKVASKARCRWRISTDSAEERTLTPSMLPSTHLRPP